MINPLGQREVVTTGTCVFTGSGVAVGAKVELLAGSVFVGALWFVDIVVGIVSTVLTVSNCTGGLIYFYTTSNE